MYSRLVKSVLEGRKFVRKGLMCLKTGKKCYPGLGSF